MSLKASILSLVFLASVGSLKAQSLTDETINMTPVIMESIMNPAAY